MRINTEKTIVQQQQQHQKYNDYIIKVRNEPEMAIFDAGRPIHILLDTGN